ncbi:MAG: non-canonical purine NTP pyrophosphatase, partial [Lachnospiraceae bacterium]|nr:non-canonical purine NTP pyrophosphatase [Lachnospiraceae bacterium]
MSKQIIFATGNRNKVKEIEMILADAGYEIRTMKEAGIAIDIVEDGKTYEENALIKVRAVAAQPQAKGC